MRAVLDANVWASIFVTKDPHSAANRIYDAWQSDEFTPIVSGPIIEEIVEMLQELREIGLAPKLSDTDIEELVLALCRPEYVVAVQHQRMGCRDLDDDKYIDTALAGGAQYLVSNDKDLWGGLPPHVEEWLTNQGIEVIRPTVCGQRDFCDVLRDLHTDPRETHGAKPL